VHTAELSAIGNPRWYLSRMCEDGLLVKVGYGRIVQPIPWRFDARYDFRRHFRLT
jgi:hypothetical protein